MVKVISALPLENYKLRILLSNGEKGLFYVSPYLNMGVFQELKEQQYFRRVIVAFGGVMWPHEQDFSPETIEYELQPEETPEKQLRRYQ